MDDLGVVEASVFGRTVAVLAAEHGVDVRVRLGRSDAGGASAVSGRRPVITVGPSLLVQPASVQARIAAHEVAHLVLDHRRPWGVYGLVLLLLVAWPASVLVLVTVAPAVVASAFMQVLVLAVLPVAVVCAVLALLIVPQRRRELDADRLACAWGHHVSPECTTWSVTHEGRLVQSRLYRPLRVHELASVREARCQDH